MPVPYAPLVNPRYAPEAAQRELEDAFDSEDEGQDSSESTPLTRSLPPRTDSHTHPPLDADHAFPSPAPTTTPNTAASGVYDFEREYDTDYDYARPPPGSPPGPSARALPNDYGNSNGLLPTGPVQPPRTRSGPQLRVPFWRKAVGALLPQHYVRVPTEEAPAPRVLGGGTENDGVFANVSAKPSKPIRVTDLDGNVHLVPEEVQKETPPSYAEAQADAVPPYWETTVHAPAAAFDPNAFMIVDDLPSGSVLSFIATAFVSFFFQFAGFVLTYLLHTTHAAKYGSRAGLGLTLIQYGLIQYGGSFGRMPGGGVETGLEGAADGSAAAAAASEDAISSLTIEETVARLNSSRLADMVKNGTFDYTSFNATDPSTVFDIQFAVTSRDWIALILMTLGWFLLLSSCVGFYRVKRWENAVRVASLPAEPLTPEQRRHDEQVRRNIEAAFGFVGLDPEDDVPLAHAARGAGAGNDNGNEGAVPDDADDAMAGLDENERRRARELAEAEMRLTRTLQAAGLL